MRGRLLGSLTGRILWLHIATAAFGALLLPLALQEVLTQQANQIHYDSMVVKADQIIASLTVNARGDVVVALPREEAPLYSETYARFAYAVLGDNGRPLASSRREAGPLFDPDAPSDDETALQTTINGKVYAGIRKAAEVEGRKLTVEVAENMAHRDVLIDDVRADFIPWIILTSLVFFGIILLIDIVVVNRAFRPLLRASALARQIGPRRTDIRLDPTDVPREARSLVTAVNEAIARLEDGYRAQRNFAADAAHELRTPLTILRARIELMNDKALSRSLRDEVDAMGATIDQLLELADVDAHGAEPFRDVDLNEVCANVLEFIAPLAIRQGREMELVRSDAPAVVRGDANMIARAVRNLVENALKHSPAHSPITVSVEAPGVIVVRDEGEGFSEEDAKRLFERFWRSDRGAVGSSGLGLVIVQRIMQQHGGAVTASSAAGEGAAFRLTFVAPP